MAQKEFLTSDQIKALSGAEIIRAIAEGLIPTPIEIIITPNDQLDQALKAVVQPGFVSDSASLDEAINEKRNLIRDFIQGGDEADLLYYFRYGADPAAVAEVAKKLMELHPQVLAAINLLEEKAPGSVNAIITED